MNRLKIENFIEYLFNSLKHEKDMESLLSFRTHRDEEAKEALDK